MDFTELFKGLASKPEIALVAFIVGMVAIGIQRLFSAGFKLLGTHLENIDNNFKSVAADLGGLRTELVKIGEKLESQAIIVDTKIDDLNRRVTRMEDKGDRQ